MFIYGKDIPLDGVSHSQVKLESPSPIEPSLYPFTHGETIFSLDEKE
ncbi:hypothetical protein [Ammoniphilus sp. 3BR4]